MNTFAQIKTAADILMGKISKAGKATNIDIHNLSELDNKLSDLQDTDLDNEEWMQIFYLREEIAGILGGEVAGVSNFSF
jgi:hypothetical protein